MKKLTFAFVLLLAAPAMAGRGATSATLIDAINSNNADVIVSEIERAEFIACSACLDPMKQLLDHPDYRVREATAWWFARRPALMMKIRDEAFQRLAGSDSILARNAADALGTFRRPEAIDPLAAAAARQDFPDSTRAEIVQALGTIADPRGEGAIVKALGDGGALTRAAAITAYLALRDGSRDGAPLVPLLTDADMNVRRSASAAIGAFKQPLARTSLEQELASDGDWMTRRNAAWALGQLGDPASQPVLQNAAAHDASAIVRSVASAYLR